MLGTLVAGLGAGILSAALGVGGGVILVPAIVFLLGKSTLVGIGTSLAVIVPTAIIGTAQHAARGNVDWRSAALLSVGAVAGTWAGVWLTAHVPVHMLKKAFAVLLIYTAYKMIR
ncbi:MAG: sulfite exporter TauE/SafE family protein [Firmicutes bacterium]|nr:sulfite exporter TauE/SafE family protein [Bacillota bacterium]